MYKYHPRRPVRSFQDLNVYQITLAISVKIVKKINYKNYKDYRIYKELLTTVLAIPVQIASAHSLRFGDSQLAIETLEKAMLNCNLAVVYLEQYRDIVNQKIKADFFEEQIKAYLQVRGKILRLQRSWQKFMKIKKNED